MWSQQVDQWDKDQVNELGPVLGQYKQEMHSFKSDLSQYVSLLEEVSFQIRLLLRTQFLLTPRSRPCHVKAVSLALRGLRRESFSSKFHEFSTAESPKLIGSLRVQFSARRTQFFTESLLVNIENSHHNLFSLRQRPCLQLTFPNFDLKWLTLFRQKYSKT